LPLQLNIKSFEDIRSMSFSPLLPFWRPRWAIQSEVDSMKSILKIAIGLVLFTGLAVGFYGLIGARGASAQTEKESTSPFGFGGVDRNDAERMMKEGQETFRFDTFGDEAFWGDTLKLHQAIEGAKLGGVGPGVSPALHSDLRV
jgi:hypothetical protein